MTSPAFDEVHVVGLRALVRAGAEDRMELDYWGVHTLNLLNDLAVNPDRNARPSASRNHPPPV